MEIAELEEKLGDMQEFKIRPLMDGNFSISYLHWPISVFKIRPFMDGNFLNILSSNLKGF